MNITASELAGQLQDVKRQGWLSFFYSVAIEYGFDTSLLLAIGSRETNLTNIEGDFHNGMYHGYGIMQIDIGTAPFFCRMWTPLIVKESIAMGAMILSGKRAQLLSHSISDPRAIAASYNAGASAVLRALAAGKDCDAPTTGGDYGADVMERAAVLQGLLIPGGQSSSPLELPPGE